MKIKKNLKPIEYDIHLKYLCPNTSCCCPHWLSFKESSTKNFKVVCNCGQIFTVHRTRTLNIEYADIIDPQSLNLVDRQIPGSFEIKKEPPIEEIKPAKSIEELAIDLMKTYGFSEIESSEMVNRTIAENPTIDNHVTLVKHSLFG